MLFISFGLDDANSDYTHLYANHKEWVDAVRAKMSGSAFSPPSLLTINLLGAATVLGLAYLSRR